MIPCSECAEKFAVSDPMILLMPPQRKYQNGTPWPVRVFHLGCAPPYEAEKPK